ncbi:MAG: hypothetical protein P8183_06410 [Anaerolineae bacterium]
MNEQFFEAWGQQVRETAVTFPYPPTPDIAGAVRQRLVARSSRTVKVRRRVAWAVVLLLLILGGLLAVPPVRAAVWRIIRAGAITIFVNEPAPTDIPPATATSTMDAASALSAGVPPTPTLQPADEYIFDLATPVTLAEAQAAARFPLRLPTYPQDLGEPDQVYLQGKDWPVTVILIWLKPGQPDQVRLSLYYIEADNYAYKSAENIEVTAVNGKTAFWVDAPHIFQLQDGRSQPWLFVEGNVLIWWTDEGVTYRLESGLPLAEARRIAESLE